MGKSSGRSGKLHTTPSVGSSVGGACKGSKVDRNGKQKRSDWYCLRRVIAVTVGLVIVIAVASYYLIATVRTTVERVHQITSHVSWIDQPRISPPSRRMMPMSTRIHRQVAKRKPSTSAQLRKASRPMKSTCGWPLRRTGTRQIRSRNWNRQSRTSPE
jgi:hypothetical protein